LNHVRWNSAFAFLDAVRNRPNLTILADTLVDRLVIDRHRAVELTGTRRGEKVRLSASRFVLSAGTFGSPAILLRSGIGAASNLQELGISVSLDLRGVGQNLHDHPGVYIEFQPNAETRRGLEAEFRAGRFYQSQVNLRARTAHADGAFDLHINSHQSHPKSKEASQGLYAYDLAPLSRGQLSLRGADPELAPAIDFQFFADPAGRDLQALMEAVPMMREIAERPALARLVEKEVRPGAAGQGEEPLAEYIRRTAKGYSHPAGTCRMGRDDDPQAVVDSNGQVHGIDNVSVADASIIPALPRANINLLCFLIGRRIADLM
jgi:choline dehydrogenase